jgi:pyridoxamine 5'-phosphate oxidase family protein
MSVFTEEELAYVAAQRLGRLATVGPDGGPQVNPVSVYVNPVTQTIDIGGHDMARSRKYRNIQAHPVASVVVDDMANGIRCLEIRGPAEAIPAPMDSAARVPGPIIRLHPRRIISWGIDHTPHARGARTVS